MKILALICLSVVIVGASKVPANPDSSNLNFKKPAVESSFKSDFDCGNVTARSLTYVCDRYQTIAGTNECLDAGDNAYINECALGVCDEYQTESGTTACILNIRNREYTTHEINDCASLSTEEATTDCMRESGRYFAGTNRLTMREIKARIGSVLEFLYQDRSARAELELEELLEDMEANN